MWRLNQGQEAAAAVNPEDGREKVNTWLQLESLHLSRDSQSSETSADLCCPRIPGTLQCSESWGRTTAASCGETTVSGLTRSFSVNLQVRVLCWNPSEKPTLIKIWVFMLNQPLRLKERQLMKRSQKLLTNRPDQQNFAKLSSAQNPSRI